MLTICYCNRSCLLLPGNQIQLHFTRCPSHYCCFMCILCAGVEFVSKAVYMLLVHSGSAKALMTVHLPPSQGMSMNVLEITHVTRDITGLMHLLVDPPWHCAVPCSSIMPAPLLLYTCLGTALVAVVVATYDMCFNRVLSGAPSSPSSSSVSSKCLGG
jgi:hypothetical protein